MAEESTKAEAAEAADAADSTDDQEQPPPHHEEISTSTAHRVVIDGKPVAYTATAGRVILTEEEGKKKK